MDFIVQICIKPMVGRPDQPHVWRLADSICTCRFNHKDKTRNSWNEYIIPTSFSLRKLLQHLTYQVKEDYSWGKVLLHTGAESSKRYWRDFVLGPGRICEDLRLWLWKIVRTISLLYQEQ